jgi:O-methyltransferase
MDGNVRAFIKSRLLAPLMIRAGWRPTRGTPLSQSYLRGRFFYDDEADIKEDLVVVREHTMTSFERMATLWQQIHYLDRYGIRGALVECGVWRGGAIGMMALAHMRSVRPPIRPLHLFDSFQGIPQPRADIDGRAALSFTGGRAEGALQSTGKLVSPLEDSKRLLTTKVAYPEELIHYHAGWFQNTLPRDAPELGDIALLRLDGDWYESTALCLKYLYSKVVKHGVVVIDDYGHFEGCRRAVDEFVENLATPILLSHADYTGRYFVKPD